MKLVLNDPTIRLRGECRSKLLKRDTQLYNHLNKRREQLKAKYGSKVSYKRMDFHIELIRAEDSDCNRAKLLTRAQQVNGIEIELTESIYKQALVLTGPNIEGYGNTHITIAFFPFGVPACECFHKHPDHDEQYLLANNFYATTLVAYLPDMTAWSA